MGKEVEVRVVVDKPEELRKVLSKIARFVKRKEQKDVYFVPKHEDYFAQDPITKYLRVRFGKDGSGVLAFHIVHLDEKGNKLYTEEHEVEVSNAEEACRILELAGMVPKVTVQKIRDVFETEDFIITLDHVKGLVFSWKSRQRRKKTQKNSEKPAGIL